MSSRFTGRAVTAAVVLLSCLGGLAPAQPAQASPRGDFSVVGHRGYPAGRYGENMMPSFASAWRSGASAVETDLHLTADRVPVLMHDDTLGRTTSCSGLVQSWTADWIRQHCRGRVGGELVPTASQFLGWGARRHMNEILELKPDQKALWTTEQLAVLDALVRRHRMQSRVLLMSFSAAVLRRAELVDPALRTQWIAGDWRAAVTTGQQFDGVNVWAGDLSAARVRRLHGAGKLVLGRSTNRRSDWRRLARVGADGLLTDRTAGYATWRRRA